MEKDDAMKQGNRPVGQRVSNHGGPRGAGQAEAYTQGGGVLTSDSIHILGEQEPTMGRGEVAEDMCSEEEDMVHQTATITVRTHIIRSLSVAKVQSTTTGNRAPARRHCRIQII
jgi:hypothetical protein